jgi:hypothetical protein
VQRGGMYIKPADWAAPPNWMPYAHVPNVDTSVANLESVGGQILVEPMDVPGGSRIASLTDPFGAPFAIHSFPAATAAKPKTPPAKKPKASLAVRAGAAKKQVKKHAKVAGKAAKKTAKKVARKVAGKMAKAKKGAKKAVRRAVGKAKARVKKRVSKVSKKKVARRKK